MNLIGRLIRQLSGRKQNAPMQVPLATRTDYPATRVAPASPQAAPTTRPPRVGLPVRVKYYEHFGADFSLDVPAEGYGGWKTANVPFDPGATAVIVNHAWDIPSLQTAPGWYSAVEGMERIKQVGKGPLSRLVQAIRRSSVPLIHVAYPGTYYQHLPGYQQTIRQWPGDLDVPQVESDPLLEQLKHFRRNHSFPGHRNINDITREFDKLRFASEVAPQPGEAIVDNPQTLFGLCRDTGINHLIYAGFTVNGCIMLAPGGAEDMRRHGILCSIVEDATTAIENHETARDQTGKAMGLWFFSIIYGFVLDVDAITQWLDLVAAEPTA